MTGLKEILLIGLDIIIFKFIGFYPGLIFLGILAYMFLKKLGFIRKPGIFRGNFPEGIVFLKDYQGSYGQSFIAHKEASNIIQTFKLKDYSVIGLYYDKQGEVEDSKLRYSYGIYKMNKGFPEKPDGDLENYCKSNNYFYHEVPNSSSLYSFWEYSNPFTMLLGIRKFIALIKQSLNDPDFKRTFKIQDTNLKVRIFVFSNESKLNFYIPIIGADKFLLYKKDSKIE